MAPSAFADEPFTFIEQPEEGYEAIRFNRAIVLHDFAVRNDAYIEPSATFIHDRILTETGDPMFCGPVAVNFRGVPMATYCFGLDGTRMWAVQGRLVDTPPGSFARIRVKLD